MQSEQFKSEVNGFVIVQNQPGGCYDNSKEWLVFHPLYDEFYMLKDFDHYYQAVEWANSQDLDKWTEELI